MTLQKYEVKYLDQLIDNYQGGGWSKYVRECHREYMDSIDEAKITEWENTL